MSDFDPVVDEARSLFDRASKAVGGAVAAAVSTFGAALAVDPSPEGAVKAAVAAAVAALAGFGVVYAKRANVE